MLATSIITDYVCSTTYSFQLLQDLNITAFTEMATEINIILDIIVIHGVKQINSANVSGVDKAVWQE